MLGKSSSSIIVHEVYLLPLLKRHNRGETISFEDLQTSFEAAKTAVQTRSKLVVNEESNSDALNQLHESQLKAYENAARAFLKSYAEKFKPPSFAANEKSKDIDEKEYVQKCLDSVITHCSGWKVPRSVMIECLEAEVRRKSKEYYSEQHKKNPKSSSLANEITDLVKEKALNTLPDRIVQDGSNSVDVAHEIEELGYSQEEDVDNDLQDEESSSEGEEDVEGEVIDQIEEKSTNSIENDCNKKVLNSDKSMVESKSQNEKSTVQLSHSSTKISLLKVNQRKRAVTSPGKMRMKKIKKNNLMSPPSISASAASTNSSTAQGKKGRGGRGRPRARRRGGKN